MYPIAKCSSLGLSLINLLFCRPCEKYDFIYLQVRNVTWNLLQSTFDIPMLVIGDTVAGFKINYDEDV